MTASGISRKRRRRYHVQKVYVIICDYCNEDITRTLGGDAPTTAAEAEEWIADHDSTFHPDQDPEAPDDHAG